jgi:hypothetical protein
MNEEASYVIEMKVSAGGVKCPMAGTALAPCEAARARIGEPSVEQ